MPYAFLIFTGILVTGTVLLWLPFRAGRRPLALRDQLAAYGILGIVAGTSVQKVGLALWIPGTAASLCGVFACFCVDEVERRVRQWAQSHPAVFFFGGVVMACTATVAGLLLGRWALSAR